MTKTQAVKFLQSKGYNTIEESGVILVEYAKGNDSAKLLKEIRSLLEAQDYHASIGVKCSGLAQEKRPEREPDDADDDNMGESSADTDNIGASNADTDNIGASSADDDNMGASKPDTDKKGADDQTLDYFDDDDEDGFDDDFSINDWDNMPGHQMSLFDFDD